MTYAELLDKIVSLKLSDKDKLELLDAVNEYNIRMHERAVAVIELLKTGDKP